MWTSSFSLKSENTELRAIVEVLANAEAMVDSTSACYVGLAGTIPVNPERLVPLLETSLRSLTL